MTSNSELILGSVSESGVNETVYNLSLDYATNMRKRLGGQISGVIYIMVDGKSIMLSIDSLMKGTAAPESIWQPEHPESRQVELIIPNYKEQPKPSSLGGAIDMISTDNYGSRKVNRKFEMDFAGRDARRLNGNLGNFIIFFKKICQDPDVRNTTRENYMYTYSKMLDFASLADFNDVNFDFLKKFEHWLSAHCGCTQNTIAKHVKVLRKAVNQAIRLGYIDVRNNPFFEYFVKVKKTEKEVLSMNDLALIDSYFHQHFDGMGEREREILGAFLFACFTVLALINNHLIVSVLRGATN